MYSGCIDFRSPVKPFGVTFAQTNKTAANGGTTMAITSRMFIVGLVGGAAVGATIGYLLNPSRLDIWRERWATWRANDYVKAKTSAGVIRVDVRDSPLSGWSENDLARADELMREANTILKNLKSRRGPEPAEPAA
jgi:hypothetical protein